MGYVACSSGCGNGYKFESGNCNECTEPNCAEINDGTTNSNPCKDSKNKNKPDFEPCTTITIDDGMCFDGECFPYETSCHTFATDRMICDDEFLQTQIYCENNVIKGCNNSASCPIDKDCDFCEECISKNECCDERNRTCKSCMVLCKEKHGDNGCCIFDTLGRIAEDGWLEGGCWRGKNECHANKEQIGSSYCYYSKLYEVVNDVVCPTNKVHYSIGTRKGICLTCKECAKDENCHGTESRVQCVNNDNDITNRYCKKDGDFFSCSSECNASTQCVILDPSDRFSWKCKQKVNGLCDR